MAPSTPFIDDVANSPEVPAPQSQAPGEPRLLGAWRVVVLIAALGIVVLGLAGALIGLLLALLSPPGCLLYTSDAADDLPCVGLGGRRIIKKKNKKPTH